MWIKFLIISVPKFDWKIDVDGIKVFTKKLIDDCTFLCDNIAKTTDLTHETIIKVSL